MRATAAAFALTLLLVLGLGVVAAEPAQAWCRMTTNTAPPARPDVCDTVGTPLGWARDCIAVALNARGARDFSVADTERIVSESFGAWLGVRCDGTPVDFDVALIDERASVDQAEYNTRGGNVNLVVWLDDWRERGYDPFAFALTTVWHNTSTGEIYDADIELNEQIGTYAECPDGTGCDDGRVDLANVLTHEIGHFFGIAHSDVSTSTMWWMANAGDIDKRILRTDDIEAMCSMYPPSGAATCDLASGDGELGDFTPRGGLSLIQGGGGGGGGCSASATRSDGASWALIGLVFSLVVLGARRRRR